MARILVKVAFAHSDNGWHVNEYEAGQEYDVSDNCTAHALEQKLAEIVEVVDVEDEGDAADVGGSDEGTAQTGDEGSGTGDDETGDESRATTDGDESGQSSGDGDDSGTEENGSENEDPEKSETGESGTEDTGTGETGSDPGDPPPAPKITPAALTLATEYSLDPATLTGTGTDGTITVGDVRVAVAAK